ncbi:MAG: hypothetical protein HUJ53_01435 [Holdemanella sp.]|nr:hypothetical protein [Holdemanella sp.]
MKYNEFEIERFEDGFTVWFEGDEIYFTSVKEAQEFIDSLEGTYYKVIEA